MYQLIWSYWNQMSLRGLINKLRRIDQLIPLKLVKLAYLISLTVISGTDLTLEADLISLSLEPVIRSALKRTELISLSFKLIRSAYLPTTLNSSWIQAENRMHLNFLEGKLKYQMCLSFSSKLRHIQLKLRIKCISALLNLSFTSWIHIKATHPSFNCAML